MIKSPIGIFLSVIITYCLLLPYRPVTAISMHWYNYKMYIIILSVVNSSVQLSLSHKMLIQSGDFFFLSFEWWEGMCAVCNMFVFVPFAAVAGVKIIP